MLDPNNIYTQMQKRFYGLTDDPIYGAERDHNNFTGYKYLFKRLKTKDKAALDFGCGLGRGMKLYKDLFKRIDGADINENYLNKCEGKTYLTDGVSLKGIASNKYDIVYSTTVLQHIPVWTIRFNLLEEFYRVLKSGGWITIQMGLGKNASMKNYYEDFWEAKRTNSGCDVEVDDPNQIRYDLDRIGFKNFSYQITDVGPGDTHDNWIFFRGQK